MKMNRKIGNVGTARSRAGACGAPAMMRKSRSETAVVARRFSRSDDDCTPHMGCGLPSVKAAQAIATHAWKSPLVAVVLHHARSADADSEVEPAGGGEAGGAA